MPDVARNNWQIGFQRFQECKLTTLEEGSANKSIRHRQITMDTGNRTNVNGFPLQIIINNIVFKFLQKMLFVDRSYD